MCQGITTDSRTCRPGSVFVALRGLSHDGHDHLSRAVLSGAQLVVVERGRMPVELAARVNYVEVADTLVAWGDLARAHLRAERRRGLPLRTLMLTGSAGKTTTKELCKGLLLGHGPVVATHGNLNNRVGLPAMAMTVGPTHKLVVLEAGMSEPGEIAELSRIAEPDVGLITNIGVAHAAGVGGGRAAVAREKGALFEQLRPDAVAIVNADDEAVVGQLARSSVRRVLSFGRSPDATHRLIHRSPVPAGASLLIRRTSDDRDLSVHLPLHGEAAAVDFLAAVAAADALLEHPLSVDELEARAATMAPADGRMKPLSLSDGTLLLDDTYNANPASMAASLSTLAELAAATSRPAVAVLGEMRELGPLAEDEHARIGELVVRLGISELFVFGDGAEALARAARLGKGRVTEARDLDDLLAKLTTTFPSRPIVLLKASRGVRMERVVSGLHTQIQGGTR